MKAGGGEIVASGIERRGGWRGIRRRRRLRDWHLAGESNIWERQPEAG